MRKLLVFSSWTIARGREGLITVLSPDTDDFPSHLITPPDFDDEILGQSHQTSSRMGRRQVAPVFFPFAFLAQFSFQVTYEAKTGPSGKWTTLTKCKLL
jgi:hypothetical protein